MARAACALGAALVLLAALPASRAHGAADPLFVFPDGAQFEQEEAEYKALTETPLPLPPVAPFQEGSCGIGVAPEGYVPVWPGIYKKTPEVSEFYVSNYYHDAIDVVGERQDKSLEWKKHVVLGQFPRVDPIDGPCGVAVAGGGALFVDDFHHSVIDMTTLSPLAQPALDPAHHLPTGVAFSPSDQQIYVDNRTYVTVFKKSSGAQVMAGLEPLRIGNGSLADGYGIAVSGYPSTEGLIYVPDAATKTVKIYDPAAIDKAHPIGALTGPPKGFTSLKDSAVAIDDVSGRVYVIDNLASPYTEEPEAAVDVFNSQGTFLGALKYRIFDALPAGLAVNNSNTLEKGTEIPTQGRVYVTTGNTDRAGVYLYPPVPQTTTGNTMAPSMGMTIRVRGAGGGSVRSAAAGVSCPGDCSTEVLSGSSVTLTATPDGGSRFAGWSGGDCPPASTECTLEMSKPATVAADFEPAGSSDSAVEGLAGYLSQATSRPAPAAGRGVRHRPATHRRHRRHRRRR